MTAVAVLAELAVVGVVEPMAIDARSADRGHCPVHGGSSVTTLTAQAGVCTLQRKIRCGVMIESPQRPCERRMTFSAIRTERCRVDVVVGMAVDALLVSIMEGRRCMTVLANDFRMPAEERETGEIVVETNTLDPVDFDVAVRADITELTRVRLVVGVTADTLHLRQCDSNRIDMAIRAGRLGV
jgi:hypothetical protein